MPLKIVEGKIEEMAVDAIVNTVDFCTYTSGESNTFFRAAGPDLIEAYRQLGVCKVGHTVMTGGFNLPCKYVIHVPRPRSKGDLYGDSILRSCYEASINNALVHGCRSIAIPVIAENRSPASLHRATRIAEETITSCLQNNDVMVFLVVETRDNLIISQETRREIQQLFDELLVEANPTQDLQKKSEHSIESSLLVDESTPHQLFAVENASKQKGAAQSSISAQIDEKAKALDRLINDRDESFQQMLMRKIAERGLTDAQCYKQANIDRKLFSKIRSDVNYKPSKPTAVAFAVALELTVEEAEELLGKAGFALSKSSKFDVIIRYFIEHHNYSITEINEVLFYYDQSLLGG